MTPILRKKTGCFDIILADRRFWEYMLSSKTHSVILASDESSFWPDYKCFYFLYKNVILPSSYPTNERIVFFLLTGNPGAPCEKQKEN